MTNAENRNRFEEIQKMLDENAPGATIEVDDPDAHLVRESLERSMQRFWDEADRFIQESTR